MFNINDKYCQFLAEDMCIDLEHLKIKIESQEISSSAPLICQSIEILCNYVGKKTKEDVNNYCVPVLEAMTGEPYIVMDSIRMAFFRFISGGMKELFEHQENEVWFPKIILKIKLEPNDIELLDDELIIYRGCDISEFELRKFGQSWSTCENVARRFAYEHYCSQPWFLAENRVVVRATYQKSNVLYANQAENSEYEIAVDPIKLVNIEIITSQNNQANGAKSPHA